MGKIVVIGALLLALLWPEPGNTAPAHPFVLAEELSITKIAACGNVPIIEAHVEKDGRWYIAFLTDVRYVIVVFLKAVEGGRASHFVYGVINDGKLADVGGAPFAEADSIFPDGPCMWLVGEAVGA